MSEPVKMTAMAEGSLLAGTIVDVAFQEITVAIKESKSWCSNFRDALNSLENTTSLLSPMIKEMDWLNQELGDSNKRGDYSFVSSTTEERRSSCVKVLKHPPLEVVQVVEVPKKASEYGFFSS